jgi:spermidine synthase
MAEHGMLATNLLTRHRGVDASLARLAAAFDRRAMALAPCASGNVIALAACGAPVELDPRELATRAAALRAESELNLAPTVERLSRRQKAYDAPAAL